MDKYSGKKLDNRYEINELIGTGGMAMVYRAYDTIDDRTVAIKILKDEFSANEEFVRRFKNESKAIAVLKHPNIVKVYDVSFGDVIQYIVMEYIDGITLKEYIDLQENGIGWKEAVLFTTQILKALEHAHSKGIIHRDIKPQNIMLLQDGTIKVTDFGIAHFSSFETRTMTDKAIGSVHYIAPEQARGESTDGKTDIYSLGAMLYEMLTGKLPFEADSAVSVALMQLQQTPKPIKELNPEVPDGLVGITTRAMQKNPAFRYQSAKEMLADIELFKNNPSIVFSYKYKPSNNLQGDTRVINRDVKSALSRESYADEYGNYMAEAEKAKPPTNSIIVGIISAFVLVAVVCCILGAFRACTGQDTMSVDTPNFVGMNANEVISGGQYDFKFETVNSFDPNQAIGTILKQSPEAGSKQIKEGSTITLTVNSTSTVVSVPYVKGSSADNAKEKINDKNLKAQIIYVEDEETEAETVVDTTPKAGSKVEVDSSIKVFVKRARDKNYIRLANVVGKTIADAKNTLESQGFAVDYEYVEKVDKPKDTVIAQNPGYGVDLKAGETIKLLVSRGISKKRTCILDVDMPANIEADVYVRVTVDGVVNTEYSKTIVPKYSSTYKIKLSGEGTVDVRVSLDNSLYREYTVSFDEGRILNQNKYNFVWIPSITEATEATEASGTDAGTTAPPTDNNSAGGAGSAPTQ